MINKWNKYKEIIQYVIYKIVLYIVWTIIMFVIIFSCNSDS